MSEYLNNNELRVKQLYEFSKRLMNDENGSDLVEEYQEVFEYVKPHDLLKFEDMHLKDGVSVETIKKYADRMINVFYETLNEYKWNKGPEESFLYYLLRENEELTIRLEYIKSILVMNNLAGNRKMLLKQFRELNQVNDHYLKKENILFPYLEKKMERDGAMGVMWSLHDDVRKSLKRIITILEDEKADNMRFNVEVGKFYFLIYGVIQKEELIMFPVASEVLSEQEWEDMYQQSFEYEFSFIEKPEKRERIVYDKEEQTTDHLKYVVKSETGEMTLEQTLMVLNKLPLDITFVDENNKVKFFSKPEDRFFPRSPAIIGREVKNCHPPESVHVVEEIVEAFRAGTKDTAKFWIQMRGKFILIQYFALRDDNNVYKGVLEVSQDVTDIRSLEGQKRLLDWEK